MKYCGYYLILILGFTSGCHKQIPARLGPFAVFQDYHATEDSVWMNLQKLIPGPIHSYPKSSFPSINEQIKAINPIILTDSINRQQISLAHQVEDSVALSNSFNGSSFYGNPKQVGPPLTYAWPFPKGKKYKIIQAYNGSFSHQSLMSRYAIDISLAIGDTICAAQDGLVVAVLQENTIGGADPKYRDFANTLTIYHPDGYLTQYSHFKPNSALVEAGAQLKKGQPIALSGLTGFTDVPHLHFNVLKPIIGNTISAPATFEQMEGKELKRGMWVEH